jgi:DNA-binding response OmpR family regulator
MPVSESLAPGLARPRLLVLSQRPAPAALTLGSTAPVMWCDQVQAGWAYLQHHQAQGGKGADLVILDASLPRSQALALLNPLRRCFGIPVMLRAGPR